MKRNFLHAFASMVFICSVSNAALLIDDFTSAQALQSIDSGSTNSGIFSLTAIGGARNISLEVLTPNLDGESSFAVVGGRLGYSNAVGMDSILTIIWDGGTDSSLTTNGFSPVDLTEGGQNDVIRFSTEGDFALSSTLTLWSGDGNFATWNFILPSSPALTNVDLAFGAQSSSVGAFDITAVTAVRLIVNGITNSDRSIDFVAADTTTPPSEVPEPGTMAVVGFGSIAAGIYSRRRRQ
jgi:hypothetical protein